MPKILGRKNGGQIVFKSDLLAFICKGYASVELRLIPRNKLYIWIYKRMICEILESV